MDKCEARNFILAHLEGAITKGHDATKEDLTQRAKVGYCPRHTQITHVAAPLRYIPSEYSGMRDRGLALWMSEGPWAGRRLAASTM